MAVLGSAPPPHTAPHHRAERGRPTGRRRRPAPGGRPTVGSGDQRGRRDACRRTALISGRIQWSARRPPSSPAGGNGGLWEAPRDRVISPLEPGADRRPGWGWGECRRVRGAGFDCRGQRNRRPVNTTSSQPDRQLPSVTGRQVRPETLTQRTASMVAAPSDRRQTTATRNISAVPVLHSAGSVRPAPTCRRSTSHTGRGHRSRRAPTTSQRIQPGSGRHLQHGSCSVPIS